MKTISGNVLCVAILGVLIASPWALAQPACDAPPVPSGEYPVNGTADLPVDVALSWVDTAAKMGPIPPPMTGAKAGERVYPAGAGIIPDGTPSPLKAGGLALPFLDNMEGGANGWQASGYWHQITNPQLLSVSGEINPRLVFLPDSAGALPAAFSGTTCWWYGEDSTGTFLGNDFWRGQNDGSGGTSVGPNGGMLTSPKIDLTAALNATLSFKTWWEIEGVDVDRFDMMYVEVSTDGGQVYLPLGAGSINPANDVDGEAWRPFSSKGLGETGEWINVTFDLTPHVGHEAIVRFRFETIDELYNGFRGWFIDDVSVQGVVTPPPVLISVDPGSGYKDTLVYLTGNNFVNGATVHIGTVKAETIVVSSSTCHVTVPDMPAGLYDVTLTNPDGQSSTLPDAFQVTIVVPPSVTQIVPYWGYENAVTAVEITGTDFKYGATASVGGTALMGVVVVSATKITGSVPAGLPVGFQNVRVTNPDEQFGSLIGGFQVVAACPTTYDVYLSGQLICENTPYRTCKPAFLLEGREYEWQVVAKNRSAQTPGPVWSFSTEGLCGVPATPIGPSPAPQATGVPVNTALTWTLPPSVPKNGVPGDDPYVEPPVSPWKAVSVNGEMFTTTDNQNNAGTGKVDYDMDKYLYRSNSITPIECDVQYSGTGTPTSVQLLIYAWDVDETGEVVNNILCLEVDNVYFNGTLVGKMTGANDEWSTTALDVAPALLQTGKNRVKVTVDEEQRTIKRWAINVDWVQLIVNDEPSGEASIRYAVTDATDYMPGDTVKGTVEVDTTASTQQVKVETNLLDPSGVNVAGTSTTYTVALNADDPMSVNLLLPPAWQEGAYTFQVFVYDAVSGIVQDSATTQFHVGACVPSYDVYLNGNLVCAGVYTLSCNPGVLQPRTDYTWQVIARNASFTVYSESWTFRTEGDDLTPPVIQINGSKDVTVERGVPYVDLGAAATDDVDGIVTANIVTSGLPIDTCYAGVYYVTYNVSDAAGNAAVTVVRTVHVVDTTPPVISMLGSSPVDVSYGAAYHDAGATALDACGDNLTGAIVTQSTVDVLLLGTYQVRYNVSDVFGNAAAQVVRTVRVVDTVAPVITLSGAPVVEVVVNAVYVDAGATAFDICDGDLTAQIAVNGLPVSTAIAGEHTITYDVKDSSGNAAPQVTRTVRVVPGSAPVISLTGNTQITVECCATYRDEGATALDAEDGDLTNAVAVGGLPIDTCEPGQYTITYDVEDSSGNKAPRMTRTVDVVDNQPPVITLLGASSITVVRNKPFTDPGAEAQDKCEGDLTAAIVKGGATVNTAVLGTYVLTYNVADASGNTAAEVTRTVNVVAGSAPVVVLTGMNPVVIGCCDNYTDAGATAVDLEDGNLTANIVTAGLPIDTCVPGTYFVDYNVTDSSLNPAMQVTRTVVVEDTMPPVITIVGDASITLERGDTYVEAGATALDACQGDLTGSIVTVSWVNTCVVGQYAVMYNVADAAGNEAVEVVRNVTVEDTVGPVISLNGDGLVEVECCTAYVDAWATALDVCGEDLTGNIAVTGLPINSFIPGDYTVRYNVSDYTGNAAVEAVRTVRVVDTAAPVITLNGSPSVDVLINGVYTDAGATAQDSCDGDVSSAIVTGGLPVNTSVLGSYTVTYNVSDSSGNAADQVERTVNVVPGNIPVITLVGSDTVEVDCCTTYRDQTAKANDVEDGDLTQQIVVSGLPIDTCVLGPYEVRYDVVDSSGNAAMTAVRRVNVTDKQPPVITLLGGSAVTVLRFAVYDDLGATATDKCEGDLSAYIVPGGTVDTSTLGVYLLTYDVSDNSGNAAVQVTRTVTVIAGNAPEIMLIGADPVTVECCGVYNDEGATASDFEDGDLTGRIDTTGLPVDTCVPGAHFVRYNVLDSSLNPATEMTRTVIVEDNTPPIINLLGNSVVGLEGGDAYVDDGATATDACQGDLTAVIVVVNPVDTHVPGVYMVTYNVSDAAGNAAPEETREVRVVDTVGPVITLVGDSPVTVESCASYADAGATALDACEGDVTANIVVGGLPIDTSVPGDYTVTYNVSDSTPTAASEVTRTVRVVDSIAPVITLNGSNPVEVVVNAAYSDAGAVAYDDCSGALTPEIVVGGLPVVTSAVGSFTVTYDVTDAAGNPAVQVTRTVNVVPGEIPVITLAGDALVTVDCCSTYRDEGATALDAEDGDLTNAIVTSGLPVDTCTVGQHEITYNVVDSSGNVAVQLVRTVDVVDQRAPVIALNGAALITVVRNKTFTDPGVTALDKCEGDLSADVAVGGDTVNTTVLDDYVITYNVSDGSGNAADEVTRTVSVVAGSAPVIALNGSNPETVACCATYSDAGATASDLEDGNVTANIVVTGLPIDTCEPGTYFVEYNVTDSSLNLATEVMRTVVVVDTVPPVITLAGAASVVLERGDAYADDGATAMDACQGDLTNDIAAVNLVNACIPGDYVVLYNVADASGNQAAEVTRNVKVVDTVAPVITLVGDALVEVECCTAYLDEGATALDVCGEDLTANVTVTGLPINSFIPGDYVVRYNVSDSSGNPAAEVVRTVRVIDTVPPVITLNGAPVVEVVVNAVYVDAGATALDICDGDRTGVIEVGGLPVVTSAVGSFTVTYDVADDAGNVADQVTRTVNVVPGETPEIELDGDALVNVECCQPYTDAGAQAFDVEDGNLTGAIVVSGLPIDTCVLGTYIVTYGVTDSSNNVALQVERQVVVADTTPPVIALNGPSSVTLDCGEVWQDEGATATDECEGDLTNAIVVAGQPASWPVMPGEYPITYNVMDNAGNAAETAVRTIVVRDNCDFRLAGTVRNSLTGRPVAGVLVDAVLQQTVNSVLTADDGYFLLDMAASGFGPYGLNFSKDEYEPVSLTGLSVPKTDNEVYLVPLPISRPNRPVARSAPKSVYVTWQPNPEYNIQGYNVYRVETDKEGHQRGAASKINGDPSNVYDGFFLATEYVDMSVEKGRYYVYMIQAISGADRPSELSDPSEPPVKGEWLTVFFPEETSIGESGVYLWDRTDTTGATIIPICARSVYEVSTTGMGIVAHLPAALIEGTSWEDIEVMTTGVTAGMEYDFNLLPLDPDTLELLISAEAAEDRLLFGSGTIFYVVVTPSGQTGCDTMRLIPEDLPAQQGVMMFEYGPWPRRLDIDLENGLLCGGGNCIHGDANNDGVVDDADARFVNQLWVKKAVPNECNPFSADINLDTYIDAADATLILRWFQGKDITPMTATKSGDLWYESFAAATALKSDGDVLAAIGTVDGLPGGQVQVPITLTNAQQTAGFSLVVSYPAGDNGLTFLDASMGEVMKAVGSEIETNDEVDRDKGSVRVVVAGSEAMGSFDETVVLTLNFEVGAKAAVSSEEDVLPINLAGITLTDPYGFEPEFDAPYAPDKTSGGVKLPVSVLVPNVTLQSQTAAEAAILAAQLTVGVVSTECSNTVAMGNVIWQDPMQRTPVAPGSVVNLTVSTGPCPVTVPNVAGMKQSVAAAAILAAQLTVGVVSTECSNTVAMGNVISQDPAANTLVAHGTAVNLTVSTGPCTTTVPNVVGMAQATAEAAIVAAGLTAGAVTTACSDTVAAGNVISQNPAANASVAPGTAVSLVVSTGACPVAVPNVTGMTQADAVEAIVAAGLTVGTVTEEKSKDVDEGSVIRQDPAANTLVARGTAVNLVVSQGWGCFKGAQGAGKMPMSPVPFNGEAALMLLAMSVLFMMPARKRQGAAVV